MLILIATLTMSLSTRRGRCAKLWRPTASERSRPEIEKEETTDDR